MRPNPSTDDFTNMAIWIKEVNAPSAPFPLHSRMDVYIRPVEVILPRKNIVPLLDRKCKM
jgi:hypothetical protein